MKILLIEDEVDLQNFIKKGLKAEMCIVEAAATGKEGIALARQNTYDAVVLDFHLPDMTGAEVCAKVRSFKPSVPILVLSVEASMDIKIGMLSSCDDYMTKPFSLRELLVRLRALTRRGQVIHTETLAVGDLEMDLVKHTLMFKGKLVALRNKEFALLEYFMKNPEVVLSREMILEHVWDMNADPFTNTVDVHVRLLRKKLHTGKKSYIHTVPKRGYKFDPK